jgi:F-type H+-transporting ATPase subunit a
MSMLGILASGTPLDHVVQHPFWSARGITILSNHIVMQMVAAVLLIVLLRRACFWVSTGDLFGDLTPRGGRNFVDTICSFLRDYVARPNLGDQTDRFIPYLWTVFFFILLCNVLGLVPLEPLTRLVLPFGVGGTATGNIWTTGTLAVCTLVVVVGSGFRENGTAYLRHFFQGPLFIAPLIAVLELIGLAAKTFALAFRLFANMIAGHILLAVLLSLIGMAGASGLGVGLAAAVPIVLVSVVFNFLELFVAFLQAFVFTFLTAVFIGQAVQIHHGEPSGEAAAGAGATHH